EFKSLKKQKLIEGRRPNLRVSEEIARTTDTLDDYLNKRGIDKNYCKKMVVELVEAKGNAVRADIDRLLVGKLSDALTDDQKSNFITNLLQEMRRDEILEPEGYGRWARWRMHKSQSKQED
ncbi:transcriptional regulator, partial [Planctomycetota bacterium]